MSNGPAALPPGTSDSAGISEAQFLAASAEIQETGATESLASTATQESLSAGDKLSEEAANVNK